VTRALGGCYVSAGAWALGDLSMNATHGPGMWRLAGGLLVSAMLCACDSRVTGDDDQAAIDRRADGIRQMERGSAGDAREGSGASAPEAEAGESGDTDEDGPGRGVPGPSVMADRADAGDDGDAGEARDEGSGADGRVPDDRFFVPATGPCPDFRAGQATFMPDGRARRVEIAMSDRVDETDGALVFSWFATGGTPDQALGFLGRAVIAAIEDQGGIVVAPYADQPSSRRPWYNTPSGPGEGDQDLRLMDEVVACARASIGIDLRRIHSIGMSAGGLQTSQVALRRSGYLASVVVYSGGLPTEAVPPDQDPANKFASMILYGGATDISPVDGISFPEATDRLVQLLGEQERFVLLCDHGGGHSVPVDAQQSVWRFFTDHQYGTQPSPYAEGIPDGFVDYCVPQ
jgi:predicted esterase